MIANSSMCFSEKQSYVNFILLVLGALYKRDNWRIALPLAFLSLKELLQGLLYRYKDNKIINKKLTILSWVHIGFQPLFVNFLMSNFSVKDNAYWNSIFLMCILFSYYFITSLDDLDIQNDPDCDSNDKEDMCADETLSYQGKYHIAYRFRTDINSNIPWAFFTVLMFLPALLTSSKLIGAIFAAFAGAVYWMTQDLKRGEFAAIWCFTVFAFVLPVGLLEKKFV